ERCCKESVRGRSKLHLESRRASRIYGGARQSDHRKIGGVAQLHQRTAGEVERQGARVLDRKGARHASRGDGRAAKISAVERRWGRITVRNRFIVPPHIDLCACCRAL